MGTNEPGIDGGWWCATAPRIESLLQKNVGDKVVVEPVTTLPHPYISEVELTLTDGSVLRATGDASKPAAAGDLDRQWARLIAKFTALASPVKAVERVASTPLSHKGV